MMRTHGLAALLSLAFLSSLPAQEPAVGAAAPALTLTQWVRGEALAKFEPGVCYVVEFWGADPDMGFRRQRDYAALTKAHGKKLGIVGVMSGAEDYDFEGVAEYYAEHGKGMDYRVAFDGDGKAHAAWVDAAEQEAPVVFVVDGKGKVAWIGGFGFLDVFLPKIVAGDFDAKALAEETAAVQQQFLRVVLVAGLKPGTAIEEMEKLLKAYPVLESIVVPTVYNTLLEGEEPQLAEALQARVCEVCIRNEDSDSLNMLAWTIVDPEVAKEKRDLATAERAAKKAVELTGSKDASSLDTLARVHYWKEEFEQAVAVQKKAIALLEEGEEREGYEATLKEYVELLRSRK